MPVQFTLESEPPSTSGNRMTDPSSRSWQNSMLSKSTSVKSSEPYREQYENEWVIESLRNANEFLVLTLDKDGTKWSVWARFSELNSGRYTGVYGRTLQYCIRTIGDALKQDSLHDIDEIRLRNINTGEVIPAAVFA